jgi:cobalamin biosynthesis protein CobD/CbiB
MAFGTVTGLLTGLLDVHPLLLLAGLIILLVIVFYVVKGIIKAAVVGVFSAFLVVAANLLGVGIPLTFQTLIMAAILGIVIHTILTYLELGFRVLRTVLSPVTRRLRKKDAVREK